MLNSIGLCMSRAFSVPISPVHQHTFKIRANTIEYCKNAGAATHSKSKDFHCKWKYSVSVGAITKERNGRRSTVIANILDFSMGIAFQGLDVCMRLINACPMYTHLMFRLHLNEVQNRKIKLNIHLAHASKSTIHSEVKLFQCDCIIWILALVVHQWSGTIWV